MKKSFFKLQTTIILLILASVLAACGAGQQAQPTTTPLPAQKAAKAGLVVEGRVVPNESVKLSFGTSGKVAEVLVKEGDTIKVGQVIARLGDRETLESQIAASELELFNAQQALSDLNKNKRQAQDIADSMKGISEAQKALKDAKWNLFNFTVPTSIAKLDVTEAVSETAKKLETARKAFEPYRNYSQLDSIRKDLKDKLDDATTNYNSAVRWLELTLAVQQAEARLEQAQQDYDTAKLGPDPDKVAAAQARIKTAETTLASAKASLNKLDLLSTIDGTVVTLDMKVGEQVSPGQAVIELADFSKWFVETDNLTEIDVVRVSENQKVSVVADALPDVKLPGTVTTIGKQFEEKRGDVTYTVKIALDKVDPKLRWGMTVAVTFP